jgi:hypothetical protein
MGDIWQYGCFVDYVAVQCRHMNYKRESRSVIIHPDAKAALAAWLMEMQRTGTMSSETYFFPLHKELNRPLCPCQASPAASLCRVSSHREIVEPHDEKNVWANRL